MNKTHANKVLAEVKALDVEIAAMQAERAVKVAVLAAEAGQEPGRHTLPAGTFTLSENNTYAEDVMRSLLTPGQVRRVTVPKLDKPTVKRLYPEVYLAAKRNNGVKVTIG